MPVSAKLMARGAALAIATTSARFRPLNPGEASSTLGLRVSNAMWLKSRRASCLTLGLTAGLIAWAPTPLITSV